MKEEHKVASCQFNHTPVLANDVIELLQNLPENLLNEGLILDATIGGGGHSSLILEAFPELNLIGLDQDPNAIAAADKKLEIYRSRTKLKNINFANFQASNQFALILADLGASSPQLDQAFRGFSFRLDGPLDMRMNPSKGIKAADLLEKLSERDLADLIYKFGEERFSRRIARRIKADLKEKGPYAGTTSLAYSIAGCYPHKLRNRRIHPATKTFQALRIAINQELEALSSLLNKAPEWLLPNGYFAVISFHSLEDRLVKNSFANDNRLEKMTRKPIIANPNEISINPRSRSAKLRIARRK